MARPLKQGIDYFPFDVDLMSDRKLRRPKEKYGCLATLVYIELLCLIYKDKGYYIDYSKEQREDIHFDILDSMRGKHQPTTECIGDVIEDLVAVGLFSTELWDQNVITSHRLQCTYYKAVSDRKNVQIDWEKWLLTENEMKELGSSCSIYKNFINRPINEVNPPINEVNSLEKQQSKVNESKVNKNKICMPDAKQVSTEQKEVMITLTLNDKTEYPVEKSKVLEWAELYPAVDVFGELRKMKGWLDANPTKRKTKRGIARFINGWLSREQDKGGNINAKKSNIQLIERDSSEIDKYDQLDQLDAEWLQNLYGE